MKKAFTLLELIFVIVLIGILSGIAFYMNRPDATRADAQYTLLKLKEARYRAIGYDAYHPTSCVAITKIALSNSDTAPQHTIKSIWDPILVSTHLLGSHPLTNETICFDGLGRPHDGNSTALSTLLSSDTNITFKDNNDHSNTIILYKQSGYAIIGCNK